jgi:hypothetical protein
MIYSRENSQAKFLFYYESRKRELKTRFWQNGRGKKSTTLFFLSADEPSRALQFPRRFGGLRGHTPRRAAKNILQQMEEREVSEFAVLLWT